MYRLETGRLREELTRLGPSRVILQAPLGMRPDALRLAKVVASMGIQVVFSAGPCHGACDVAFDEAVRIGADAIIHLGHSKMLDDEPLPVIYVEGRYSESAPLLCALQKALPMLRDARTLGLGMTVQWLDFLDATVDFLEQQGLNAVYGDVGGRVSCPGQVIGCDYATLRNAGDTVDLTLVVGSAFHGLGAALSLNKEAVALEPFSGGVTETSTLARRILAQRYAVINSFQQAEDVGVLVGVKPGQSRLRLAEEISGLLEQVGKSTYIVSVDEIEGGVLRDVPVGAFVNTACPRVSIEDQSIHGKPLLLPSEVAVFLGLIEWEELINEGLLLTMDCKGLAFR